MSVTRRIQHTPGRFGMGLDFDTDLVAIEEVGKVDSDRCATERYPQVRALTSGNL